MGISMLLINLCIVQSVCMKKNKEHCNSYACKYEWRVWYESHL